MRELGIDFDLAPVIDADTNPENPNIGAIERSFSKDLAVVRANAMLLAEVARECGLQLCLKHYPGLGGAGVDSHAELTELDGRFQPAQEALFAALAPSVPGRAVLLSHGLVRSWDPEWPVSISPVAIGRLRAAEPDLLLVSDDLQMEGLRRCAPLTGACVQAIRAGLDLLCIGNNLRYEESAAEEAAAAIARAVPPERIQEAAERVGLRKRSAETSRVR
jgi:beta-N-acetylhexosaminidase